MAITNAQQYQQLVNKSANGKRPGYRGDAAYSSKSEQSSKSVGGQGNVGSKASFGDSDKGGAPSPGDTGGSGGYETNFTDQFGQVGSSPTSTGGPTLPETKKEINFLAPFSNRRKQLYNLATNFLPGSKKSITAARKAYADYLEQLGLTPSKELLDTTNLYDYFDTQAFEKNLKPVDAGMEAPMSYGDFIAEKFGMPGVKYSGDVGGLDMYVAERDPITGKPTKYGYKETRDGRNGEPVLPLTPYQEDVEDEVDPNSLEGMLANRIAYRFMADGGRAGFAEGGIMPRLNQLSGSVSSAEQMLQQINQRLQSAESSLGSGGGSSLAADVFTSAGVTGVPQVSSLDKIAPGFKGNRPLFQLPGNIPGTNAPYSSLRGFGPMQLAGGPKVSDLSQDGFSLGDQRYGTALGGGQQMALPNNPSQPFLGSPVERSNSMMEQLLGSSGGPMQSPLSRAIGLRLGGRAGFAGGGMPYEGGIMDLESARQMYGLGKLVKKATGAIKKIVKSPVGKAALLYGGFKFGAPLFKSEGFKNFFLKDASKKFALDNLSRKGVLTGIGGLSALAGLFAGQDEEDEVQPYYRGPSLDINAIRNNPYGTKGPAFGFYAEGGDVKEPVAKDTMPLLDMNGMEKDYRADGGFVPIGRMERADDVPARLSKNEFVFTADAVRNAGDGDIDKGAEVMYNVMKNLEAGGDISEESQGLNGAREMFQTSKRLEEVL